MGVTPSMFSFRTAVSHLLIAAAASASFSTAHADGQPPQIPTCTSKLGTLAVTEPQNQWWTAMQLDSPAALIKVFVAQSKCFTLVDRGKGLDAAKAERELAASGEERAGSNIGKGQMKAADYVLVPDIANRSMAIPVAPMSEVCSAASCLMALAPWPGVSV